jgi:hypothetical protein
MIAAHGAEGGAHLSASFQHGESARSDGHLVNQSEVIMSHITHAEPVARLPQRALWILAALATAAIVVTLVIVLSSGSSSSSEPAAEAAGIAQASHTRMSYEQLPAYPSPRTAPLGQ